jgi:hypothetical protein|tara:strand:- start:509 stop:772 length:264 start_codon:yes stop_codon:yes gene_type:complete
MSLDNNLVYGEPRQVCTPFFSSFLGTYQIGYREPKAPINTCEYVYVKAMSKEHAFEVAHSLPGERTVTSVEAPGEELYGLTPGVQYV